jgi:DNA polymerase-3 subunit delta'
MSEAPGDPRSGLRQSLDSGRIAGAYLLAGPGEAPRETALWLARALACQREAGAQAPCEACRSCRRSAPGEPIPLDGTGKKGPLYRHVGDHPDLLWVERGSDDTRVTIGQVRALQEGLRLRGVEGGRRCAVLSDAEWLNQQAQNALLRILEEPPPATTFVLVSASPAGLLATVRSRCQRVPFPLRRAEDGDAEASEETLELRARLAGIARLDVPDVLDWAESYRGPRAIAASAVSELLSVAASWLHDETLRDAGDGADVAPRLGAWTTLQGCRKALAQRNANPQMVAERALLALRDASL